MKKANKNKSIYILKYFKKIKFQLKGAAKLLIPITYPNNLYQILCEGRSYEFDIKIIIVNNQIY